MRIVYLVVAPEELKIIDSQYPYMCMFNGRTPREAVKKHDEFFIRKKELFGKCKCFIGTFFVKEGGKKP